MTAPIKAALYVRVSTSVQSNENQIPALLQLATARGWEPVLFEEVGSAVKHRPVFERMMEAARKGEVRAVAVVALDRLGRSMLGVLRTVDALTQVGCTVTSLREPWLDTAGPLRDVLTALVGWMAQEERRILIARTHEGLARARRQGRRLGRPRASSILLSGAADLVSAGVPVAEAARKKGVKRTTLRRYLDRLAENGGSAEPPSPSP
jgi:DNA invertase Pin-like site-specific DNA recombinase